MNASSVQRRTNKKRRITQIMDAMYRLDAIYPELRENDAAFASLITITWLIRAENQIHPIETKLSYKLYEPYIKLRRDDIGFISKRIETENMAKVHMDWLAKFLEACLTKERKSGLVIKMWAISYADSKIHPSEVKVIRKICMLLGYSDSETEDLRDKGKSLAGL